MTSLGVTLWITSLGLKFWRLIYLYELNRNRVNTTYKRQREVQRSSSQNHAEQISQLSTNTNFGLRNPTTTHETHDPNERSASSLPNTLNTNDTENTNDASDSSLERLLSFQARPRKNTPLPVAQNEDIQSTASRIETGEMSQTSTNAFSGNCCPSRQSTNILSLFLKQTNRYVRWLVRQLVSIRMLQPKYQVHFVGGVFFLSVVVTTALALLSPNLSASPGISLLECNASWPLILPNIAVTVFFVVIFPIIGVIIWNTTDAYGIRNEFLIQGLVGVSGMFFYILVRYSNGQIWVKARHSFPPQLLPEFIRFCSHVMAIAWPVIYLLYERRLLRKERKKAAIKVAELVSRSLVGEASDFQLFMEALDNSHFLKALYQYSVREFTSENPAFLKRLRNLEELLIIRCPVNSTSYYKNLIQRLAIYERPTGSFPSLSANVNRAPEHHVNEPPNGISHRRLGTLTEGVPVAHIDDAGTTNVRSSDESSNTLGNQIRIRTTPQQSFDNIEDALNAEVLNKELVMLYNEYISPHAPNELNLTSDCRHALMQAYEQNQLTFEAFEPARYEVLQLIFLNTWPRMLRSQMH
ncbi:hypothetical protein BDF19DRAFT_433007 [Syncephalis fuscata]|nr:hypothetical protein BDF19DRAFT_433007 [Syncephalis fuscata]